MKNIVLVIGVLLILFSCQKDEKKEQKPEKFEYTVKSNIPYSSISKRVKGYRGANESTELLVFSDMNSFIVTLNDLDNQVSILDSIFVDTYSHLSEDSLNNYEEAIGFTEKQPIIDFNDFFLYYSLYIEIVLEEEEWLDNEILDHATDPDNHFILENSLRAILNTDCEVQIADTLYKFTDSGYFAIPDASMKTLQILDQNQENYLSIGNVIYIEDNNLDRSETCRTKRKDGFKAAGDYRLKWVCSIKNYPWAGYAKSKTKSYKKKKKRWKKYRAFIESQISGKVTNGQCGSATNISAYSNGTKKELTAKATFWSNAIKTEKKYIKTVHKCNNITKKYTLTW